MKKTEKIYTLPTKWVVLSIVVIIILGIIINPILKTDDGLLFWVLFTYIIGLFIFHVYQNRKKVLSLITEKDKKKWRILLYIIIGVIILITIITNTLK